MNDTEALTARIEDAAALCEKTGRPKFLGFLSAEQAVLTDRILSHRSCRYAFFGGFAQAQRVVLCCMPDWLEQPDFPIGAVTVCFRDGDKLSHRDFLGSLTALGLRREAIGDILVEDGRAVIFLLREIVPYVISQTEKIGKTGVRITEGFACPLPAAGTLAAFTVTAASARLDCVVAALTGYSRARAASAIAEGLVTVNSAVTEKPTKTVAAGDVISVRRSGKYRIGSLDGKTRKNRTVIQYEKYI